MSREEVDSGIRGLKSCTTPGLDGFTVEFYRTFCSLLSPILTKTMAAILMGRATLPPSWWEATIVVIPKAGKDPQFCSEYRPISLLNTDYKVLTGLLGVRLNAYLNTWIKPDQAGFIRGRSAWDNVQQILNFQTVRGNLSEPSLLLSLDA